MRHVILMMGLVAAGGWLAGCGEDDGVTPEQDMAPDYKECEAPRTRFETMQELEAFGAQGCEALGPIGHLDIYGPEITSLEPLRSLRQIGSLTIRNTKVSTLEPLKDVQDIGLDVWFEGNAPLGNCEITAWIKLVKERDPTPGFTVTLDEGADPDQCQLWPYP